MSLATGSRLGPYEVGGKLGEGGMGEVWRARDSRLDREVAIKVLPETFVADPERLQRFEREARLLAQLNHPHVAQIYGMEASGDSHALVMELVEGPTLAERLEHGPLPVEESLAIARQIAEALEEAHEKGIVHRDLKPQNVKITADGRVKVLDFGLAKAMDPSGSASGAVSASRLAASPTLTLGATVQGVILGTAAYMAPEQAAGGVADRRADIWSFGVVLFEMLSGRHLFGGETVSHVLAGVLKDEPDFAALPGGTPPRIRRLLHRCLRKRPRERLQAIGDARVVIDEVLSGRTDEEASAAAPANAPKRRAVLALAGALLTIGGAALGFLTAASRSPARTAPSERRFAIPAADRSPSDRQELSRDGGKIVYTAGGRLWLRDLARTEASAVAGGDRAVRPFWAPDGREIGFVRDGVLWRLGVEGGAPRQICELPVGFFDGGTWTDQDTVVFAIAHGGWTGDLYQCPARGGAATVLLEPDELGQRLRRPQALPGDAGVLYLADLRSDRTEVRRLRAGTSASIADFPFSVEDAVVAGRHLYFVRRQAENSALWMTELDARMTPVGESLLVASKARGPSVADDGDLLFAAFEPPPQRLALVGRDGSATPIGEPFESDVDDNVLELSPDGKRAVMIISDPRSITWGTQLFLVDMATGARQRLPVDFHSAKAAWSPDGGDLFLADPDKGAVVPLAGGAPRPLRTEHPMFTARYAPDGAWIVYYTLTPETGRDIFRVAVDGGSVPEPLVREAGQQANPDVSPDGRFLAYQSDELGRPEIYVRPYPKGDRKWQVSTAGGTSPLWNRQGGELVWLADDAIWSAPVSTAGGSFEAGAPRLLIRGDAIGSDLSSGSIYYNRMYAMSTDGQHFLVAQRLGNGRNEMVFVENPGGAESAR